MHPTATFKDEIINFCFTVGGDTSHTLPSLCTETLGFNNPKLLF